MNNFDLAMEANGQQMEKILRLLSNDNISSRERLVQLTTAFGGLYAADAIAIGIAAAALIRLRPAAAMTYSFFWWHNIKETHKAVREMNTRAMLRLQRAEFDKIKDGLASWQRTQRVSLDQYRM